MVMISQSPHTLCNKSIQYMIGKEGRREEMMIKTSRSERQRLCIHREVVMFTKNESFPCSMTI